MDDLLKIAGNVMENFNPETDSANDFENLPDGRYTGLLSEVSAPTSSNGNQRLSLKFEITSDEFEDKYKGRLLFVPFFFSEKIAERSIKYVIKMVHDLGFEPLGVDAFKSLDDLAEALQGLVGTEAQLDQKTSKNGFANYEITATE